MHFPVAFLGTASFLLAIAALWDVRKRKIPNYLSAAIAISGLGAQIANRGLIAAGSGLAAGVVTIALLWHLWMRGKIGGGDVKAAGAAAVWIGLGLLPHYLVAMAAAGGLVGTVCYLLSSRVARAEMKTNMSVVAIGLVPDAPIRGGEGRVSVPYGVAVAIGALVVLWRGGLW
jgi:prepilin peptidase CpaA